MNNAFLAAGVAGLLITLSVPAIAQWPSHPTSGVPRTPAGEPDLQAPPPRTADGHIDFTGLWQAGGGFGGFGRRGGGRGGAAAEPADSPPVAQFFDIGAGMEGGAPYQDWARELRDQRVAEGMKDNPDAHCLPMGNMQLATHPQPRKIIQSPSLIVILYEGNAGIRQIFTDGRPLPNNDPQPWWFGYSTGRWVGDTLVVETSGFRDGGWLDVNGSPLTDAAKVTERFTRVNYGSLDIEVTVDDPKAYTRPWTVTIRNEVMLDTELIEFICLENEQSTKRFR
jgi:hypothetical protein